MWSGNYFQAPFDSQRILCKKDSEETSKLIWTHFDIAFAAFFAYFFKKRCFYQ